METNNNTMTFECYRPQFEDWAENKYTGTLEELKKMFSYTIECGREYMHEDGALFVQRVEDISDIYELEEALNNASHNSCRGEPNNYYAEMLGF